MVEERSATGDKLEGNWKQFKGKLREKWGDLTDDDLDRVKGQRERLAGVVQERTGEERRRVDEEIDRLANQSGYRF